VNFQGRVSGWIFIFKGSVNSKDRGYNFSIKQARGFCIRISFSPHNSSVILYEQPSPKGFSFHDFPTKIDVTSSHDSSNNTSHTSNGNELATKLWAHDNMTATMLAFNEGHPPS